MDTAGKGRPRKVWVLEYDGDRIELDNAQYAKLRKSIRAGVPVELLPVAKSMTEAELAEACRLGMPMLAKRAMDVALVSKDAREIMAVLNWLADRGYGKVVKTHDPNSDEAGFLRRGWAEIPQDGSFGIVDVDEEE